MPDFSFEDWKVFYQLGRQLKCFAHIFQHPQNMGSTDEDIEVFTESAPQTSYLKSLGFSSADIVSTETTFEQQELKYTQSSENASSVFSSAHRVFSNICRFIKEMIIPNAEYSADIDVIKHSGLLFKENAVLVEEFSPPVIKHSAYLNFTIIVPLGIFMFNMQKFSKIPVITFLSLSSIYAFSCLFRFYQQLNRQGCTKGLVSALKQFNKKFLKTLQFIAENDRKMMKNHSNISKIEVRGFNTFKILDPSWSHFKLLLAKSAISILRSLHSLCRDLSDIPVIDGCSGYPSVCSVDFSELGISDIDIESHQAYLLYLNKLKLLLFLMESELLSFIAINLSENGLNSSKRTSFIFLAMNDFSKTLVKSLSNIEAHFDRLYSSSNDEIQLRKNDALPDLDPDLIKLLSETRALSHLSLSMSMMVRNFGKVLESDIQALKMDKSLITTLVDELLCDIDHELGSCQHKLKSLTKLLTHIQKPSGDVPCAEGAPANPTAINKLEDGEKVGIEIGLSDYNPREPDEVFVGFSEDHNERLSSGEEDNSFEENACAAAFKKSSKILIKELKLKLKDKKIEMDEREKMALKRKNIPDIIEMDDQSLRSSDDESLSEERMKRSNFVERDEDGNFATEMLTLQDKMNYTDVQPVRSETNSKVKDCDFVNLHPSRHPHSDATTGETIKVSVEDVHNPKINPHEDVLNAKRCDSGNADANNLKKFVHFDHADVSLVSNQSLQNPLAMNITNISRVWNRQLNRTEECFGSDSESLSDSDTDISD